MDTSIIRIEPNGQVSQFMVPKERKRRPKRVTDEDGFKCVKKNKRGKKTRRSGYNHSKAKSKKPRSDSSDEVGVDASNVFDLLGEESM